MSKATMKRMRLKLAKNLGISPPYTPEEHKGLQKFMDGGFVIYDDNDPTGYAYHTFSDRIDRTFNGPNIQFTLPKKGQRWREPKVEIAETDEEVESMDKFREGSFLIWDPNTRVLVSSDETKVGFNGPNVSFSIPKSK